jgi:hypothetical protein
MFDFDRRRIGQWLRSTAPWLAAREAAVKRTSFFAHILMLNLRPLSVLADPPRIPRHLLNPAGPHKSQRQPVNAKPNPTFRIAGGDGDACVAGTEYATIPTSIATSPRRVSAREIGRRLGVARSTVQDNLKRAAAAGLAWPLAEDVTDEALELQLLGRAGVETGRRRRTEPDWAALGRELKRPGVTMMVLWEEYRAINPEGYGYSRFCDLLRGFERRLTPVMRQHHVAGEKAFVDYSGKRIGIVDPATGEIHEAEIFVGCSAPRTSPMPRPHGRNNCLIGSARMCACFASSAAFPNCWSPTI